MRLVVTGKKGQLVQALLEVGPQLGASIIPLGRPELDLTKPETIQATISVAQPDAVISAAAYTAVDRAESEPVLAFAVNAHGAGAVATAAANLRVPIVHISTDYVFSGNKPTAYLEDDATAPLSNYGHSKLAGETQVADASSDHVILRTSWLYSPFETNFLRTILRLASSNESVRIVADQYGAPTSALDLADAVIKIAARLKTDTTPELRGIFHYSAVGATSWAGFAEDILLGLHQHTGKRVKVVPISTADYPTAAVRPGNSKLATEKIERHYSITPPHWRSSTRDMLERLLKEQGISI
jgi:dTDP-4-dehydrorhamnose reductase